MIGVFIVSLVIFSLVIISFLHKAIRLVGYWGTVLFGNDREAVNLFRTFVGPSLVEPVLSWSQIASHISK